MQRRVCVPREDIYVHGPILLDLQIQSLNSRGGEREIEGKDESLDSRSTGANLYALHVIYDIITANPIIMHRRARLIRTGRPFDTNCRGYEAAKRIARGRPRRVITPRGIVEASRLHNRGSNDLSLSVRSRGTRRQKVALCISLCKRLADVYHRAPGQNNYKLFNMSRGGRARGLAGSRLIVRRRARGARGPFFRLAVRPVPPRCAQLPQYLSPRRFHPPPSLSRPYTPLSSFLLRFYPVVLLLTNYKVRGKAVVDPLR